MEEDDKSYEGEEERELLGEEDDGDLIQVDHKLQAQEFDFNSKFFSRFSVCTLLVGCYWFYPEILVRNTSHVGKGHRLWGQSRFRGYVIGRLSVVRGR